MSKSDAEQEELVERSWELIKEALTTGTMTLSTVNQGVSQRTLDTEEIVDLAKFFVQLKVKKPQAITPPEDFQLPVTSDEDN